MTDEQTSVSPTASGVAQFLPGDQLVRKLVVALAVVSLVGTIAAIAVFSTIYVANSVYREPWCFTKTCLDDTAGLFSSVASVVSATASLLILIATVGGVLIALLSYRLSNATALLGNHLAHFSSFQSFITNEVVKRPRVAVSSIDFHIWYHLMFPDARLGVLRVHRGYMDALQRVAQLIEVSNGSEFAHVKHQKQMMQALADMGISVELQPRLSYFEVESQVLTLIEVVCFVFVSSDKPFRFAERRYT